MTTPPVVPQPRSDTRSGLRRALRMTARRAHAAVTHADGVGVTLLLQGRPVYAGSNGFADSIDEAQYRLGEGPCVSAVATARVVHTTGVGTDEVRWAGFTSAASGLALRSAVSTPVLVGPDVIGSLNLYGRADDSFATALGSIVRCSEEVGRSVTALHLLATTASTSQTLVETLSDRADTDLATGLLMDRYSMGQRAARVLLQQLARLDGVSTAEAARGLLAPGTGR